MKKLNALIIMDGYGLSKQTKGNAVGANCSPFVRFLMENYPNTALKASETAVGLPQGQMGNSEVGHLNIGAGRIVYQDFLRISNSVADGTFAVNEVLIEACKKSKEGALHLLGLVSDGGVHSHMSHIYALLDMAKAQGVKKCFVHAFTDGRDTSPEGGEKYLSDLKAYMEKINLGEIATVCGRYYAMDRDNRWDRVEKAYDALVLGKGEFTYDILQSVRDSYKKGVTDEFILPTVVLRGGKPLGSVENGDSVIFFNFRPDRAREITRAFTEKNFAPFSLKGKSRSVEYATFTKYDDTFELPVAYKEETVKNSLAEYLSSMGLTQFHTAETEKYAHVTFFFNGGVEKPFKGETRILIPSPKVATYDLQPEMSARAVTERAIMELSANDYDFMILNYANCDMVGHTGNFEAAKTAVLTVDECVRKMTEFVLSRDGRIFITADHGNAEKMIEKDKPFTPHTTNKVPFIFVGNNLGEVKLRQEDGALCDIAPTILQSMELLQPPEMTGKSLIKQ